MKKNVIFWVGVKNETHNDKYGNFEYFEYTKSTWKHFCKRFNCEFVEFSVPVQKDLTEYRVNWQKAIYAFDVIDIANEYKLDFLEGNVLKYLLRWRRKNGLEDLKKAQTYLNLLIEKQDGKIMLCRKL